MLQEVAKAMSLSMSDKQMKDLLIAMVQAETEKKIDKKGWLVLRY